MNATLERTVTIDRGLARRPDRKLRRYGHNFNDAVVFILNEIVSRRGDPMEENETPGEKLLASFKEADMIEQGVIPAKAYATAEELLSDCLK